MKKTAAALAAVMLWMLFSCNEAPVSHENTTEMLSETSAGEQDEITRTPLPEKDYDGYEFNILHAVRHPDIIPNYFAVESENGEVLNDAIYKRNLLVEEVFNIKILSDIRGVNANNVRADILAGDDSYDLLIGGMATMGTLAFENHLLDLYDIPYAALDKPWWDPSLNAGLTMAHRLYFASGSLINTNNDATYIIRFNINLGEEFGVDKHQLYSMVREGSWTIDKMIELAMQFPADLNGDGERTWEDRYGIACANSLTQALFYGTGLSVVSKDSDDLISFNALDTRTQTALSKIMEIFTTKDLTINGNKIQQPGYDHAATADNALTDGRAFFQGTLIEAMTRSRDAQTAIGILPIPKLDETQESYISMINPNGVAILLGIPSSAKDTERTGIIAEALMMESYFTVRPAYLDTVLKHKLLRDEESFEMLDFILENRVAPDLGYVYSYGNLLANLMKNIVAGTGNFASIYDAAETAAAIKISEHIEALESLR